MEPEKSTKPSKESSDIRKKIGDLELPVDPHFRAFPPRLSIPEMMERIEELRRWFPEGIPTEEERLARKIDVPFEL